LGRWHQLHTDRGRPALPRRRPLWPALTESRASASCRRTR